MMRNKNTAVRGALLLVLLGGCGEVFVSSSGAGGGGGAGAATAASSGGDNQGGGPGGSAGDGGGQECAAPGNSDECQACLFDMCEAEYCACAAESDCVGLFACIGNGGPNEYCWQNNDNGIALAGRLQACGNGSCLRCGFPPVTPCQLCQYTNCASQINDCYSNAACYGFLKCFSTCVTGGTDESQCSIMCNNQYMDGVPLVQALNTCKANECENPCTK